MLIPYGRQQFTSDAVHLFWSMTLPERFDGGGQLPRVECASTAKHHANRLYHGARLVFGYIRFIGGVKGFGGLRRILPGIRMHSQATVR